MQEVSAVHASQAKGDVTQGAKHIFYRHGCLHWRHAAASTVVRMAVIQYLGGILASCVQEVVQRHIKLLQNHALHTLSQRYCALYRQDGHRAVHWQAYGNSVAVFAQHCSQR